MLKRLLALLMAFAMLLSFASCGDDDSKSKKDKDDDEEVSDTVKDDDIKVSPSKDNSDEDKVFDFVQTLQEQFSDAIDSEIYVATIEARGTSVVYAYKYIVDVPDEIADILSEQLNEENAATVFEADLEKFQEIEPAVESLIVEYQDKNGVVLVSKEYC